MHLPQIDLMGEGLSSVRTFGVVDAARDGGFVAVSANDHFVFPVPWLDGLTSLSAVVDRSGDMDLTTTLSLPSLRGPVPVAKTLAALAGQALLIPCQQPRAARCAAPVAEVARAKGASVRSDGTAFSTTLPL